MTFITGLFLKKVSESVGNSKPENDLRKAKLKEKVIQNIHFLIFYPP